MTRIGIRQQFKIGRIQIVIRFRLSLTIFFLLLAQIGAAQTREKIRVALGSISVNTSVIPIGHQYGIFAKYGVDLEPIYMGGGMNSLAAVTSNSVQFLSAGSTATISARLGGIDIIDAYRAVEQVDTDFVAPEIKTPQDLKGKIVTGTRPGASADSALRLISRRIGIGTGQGCYLYFRRGEPTGAHERAAAWLGVATALDAAIQRNREAIRLSRARRTCENPISSTLALRSQGWRRYIKSHT